MKKEKSQAIESYLNEFEIDEILKTRGLCMFQDSHDEKLIIAKNIKGNGFIIINKNGGSLYLKKLYKEYKFIKEVEHEVLFE